MGYYRRSTLGVLGGLFATSGCISFGSPSRGILEVEASSLEYSVSIGVSTPDGTVVADTRSLRPSDPIEESFELEREIEYMVSIEFDPSLRDVDLTDSVAEREWAYESETIRGEVPYSSEDQICTVSVDDAGVATVKYDTVSAP